MDELQAVDLAAEDFDAKMKVLKENVEHHIEEEEGELFPKVRKIWDTTKRQEIGRKMQEMKDQRLREKRAA